MSHRMAAVTAIAIAGLCTECGETFGGLLYHFNILQAKSVPAQFTLTEGTLLVLVDDDDGLCDWTPGSSYLTDRVARELTKHRAVKKVLDSRTVNILRQSDVDFESRSISSVGQAAGADQVLWLQIKEFVAGKEIQSISRAARCTVRVKVFDPKADSRTEKRVWPEHRGGEFVTVEKSAAEVQRLEDDEAVARKLIEDVAVSISRMFYQYKPED